MTGQPLYTANTADTEQALQIVLDRYGTLDTHDVELFKDGFDHVVYVIDGTDAFRFPKNQEYADKLPVVSRFLQAFAPLSPVAVPVSEVLSTASMACEHYTFLPGKPLTTERARTFSPRNLQIIGASIGSFLTALHAFANERAVQIGLTEDSPLDDWKRRYASVERQVLPLLSPAEAAWVSRLFDDFLASLRQHAPNMSVIHFDIKPDHIIVDPATQTLRGIIDFGDMRIGDPAYDFTYFARYTPDLTPHILQTYRHEKDSGFEDRISFYQAALPVMDLVHAIEIGAREKVAALRHVLEQSIAHS